MVMQIPTKAEHDITSSELALIKQLCLPDKIISNNFGISHAAVRMRIVRIGIKLGVENRTAIVVRALVLGLVSIDQLLFRKFNGRTNLS